MKRPKSSVRKMYDTIATTVDELKRKATVSKHIANSKDRKYAAIVIELYAEYPKHYVKMLMSEKHKAKYGRVVEWIYEKTCFLNETGFEHDLQTRLNWIFNGKDLTAKCRNDGCSNVPAVGRSLRMNDPFPEYCSTKCSTSDKRTVEKSRSTRYAANDGKWEAPTTRERIRETVELSVRNDPDYYKKRTAKCEATKVRNGHDPKWNNRPKMKETVEIHKAADPEYYEKITTKTKATKVRNGHCENWVNPDKAKATNIERRGVPSPMMDPTVVEKSKSTFRMNHPGMTSSFELPGVYEKSVAVWLRKYGTDSPLKVADIREKIVETWINNYGVDNPWKVPSVIEKSKATKLEIYGAPVSPKRRYEIDGERFDSGWEAYVWLYCKDNMLNVERNPCEIKYEYGTETHSYFPDFRIDGELVEIKGDQFFRPDGTMFCPYRHKTWTDADYADICGRYEAKHQCMIANNVRILRFNEILKIIQAVDSVHGKNCVKTFKI